MKNAKRYCDFLERHGIDQNMAFERSTITAYHVYVSRLRKTVQTRGAYAGISAVEASRGGKRATTSRA